MRFLTVGLGGDVDALLASLAPDVVVTSEAVASSVPPSGRSWRGRATRFLPTSGRDWRRPVLRALRDQRRAGGAHAHRGRMAGGPS